MNPFQPCSDASDAVELFPPQGLYLKPIARLNISVQLPLTKSSGKTISNYEVMDKLRNIIKPEEFILLKVSKSTLEFIRFEAEIESKSKLMFVIGRLEGSTLKLNGFLERLKIRAAEAKISFPTRHAWDSYFRDAKNMNEMKPGERPDTIHITNLPCKWFAAKQDVMKGNDTPNEYIFRKVFEVFGDVRCVDIPAADPYRSKMKTNISGIQMFSFGQELYFEGYVQYKEYICFVKAMDALRGMKLLFKDGDSAFIAGIKVDFDKTKHLSEPCIRRRRIEREKLMALEREEQEKERLEQELAELQQEEERQLKENEKLLKLARRKQREEKRRQMLLLKMKSKETEEMTKRIALEERKLLIAQRKLESIRLLSELFERLKNVVPEQCSPNNEEKTEDKTTSRKQKEEKVNLPDRDKELRRRLVDRYNNLHKQQSDRLQMTREGKEVSSTQLTTSEITSSESELSLSSSESGNSRVSQRYQRSSSLDERTKWKEQRYSEEDVSEFSEQYLDDVYPRYNRYHYSHSHLRPFRGRRFNYNRRGFFPYRQRFHRRGGGSFYQSLPERMSDAHGYYSNVNEEYFKYFRKLARQDTLSSQESSSHLNSRSRSKSSSVSSLKLSSSSTSQHRKSRVSKSGSEDLDSEVGRSHSSKQIRRYSKSKARPRGASRTCLESVSLSSFSSGQEENSNNEYISDGKSKPKKSSHKKSKKNHHLKKQKRKTKH